MTEPDDRTPDEIAAAIAASMKGTLEAAIAAVRVTESLKSLVRDLARVVERAREIAEIDARYEPELLAIVAHLDAAYQAALSTGSTALAILEVDLEKVSAL